MIAATMKLCGKCGQHLPLTSFSARGSGLQAWCKGCHKAHRQEYRAQQWTNGPRVRKRIGRPKGEFLLCEKVRRLLSHVRSKGPTDIDAEWIELRLRRGLCEVTGIPFFMEEKRHPMMPSIDRIDSSQKGYMRSNCQMVLWCLNSFKGTATQDVFLKSLHKVARAVVKQG